MGKITKAGKYVANQRGFIFEQLREEGDTVVISAEFLKAHKAKHGADFSASWLDLKESAPAQKKEKAPTLLELKAEYEDKFKEPPEATWTETELRELLSK